MVERKYSELALSRPVFTNKSLHFWQQFATSVAVHDAIDLCQIPQLIYVKA